MIRNRSAVLGLTVVIGVAVLAGCSGPGGSSSPGSSDAQVTLTYATVATGDVLAKGETPVINAFMVANPNIKVTIESVPVANYSTKLTTEFRGGQGPDLGRVNTSDLRTWQNAGFLSPLDDVVKNYKIDTSMTIPSLLQTATINNSLVALPLGTDTRVLYYNPKLLSDHGITAPPATWDELLADVKKFAGTDVYGYAFMDSGNDYAMSSESIGPYIKGAGGRLVTVDGTKAIASTTQATIDAAQFVQDLVKTGATPKGGSITEPLLAQLFSQNKLAMMLGGPWVRQDILTANPDFKYGTSFLNTTVPVQKAGMVSGSISGGWFVGVFKNSKHQDAANKLLAYIQQKENLGTINSPEAFPPRTDGLSMSPWSNDPFYQAYSKQLEGTGRIIPALAGTHEIAVDFLNAMTPVMLDPTKSVTDALKQFDDTVNGTVLKS